MKKYLIGLVILIVSILVIYTLIDLKPNIKSNVELRGIDISHYNDIRDWSQIKKSVDFVYIKSTEGKSYKDPNFKRNWRNAKKNNVTCGAYHFFTPGVSAYEQFVNFKNTVKLSSGDLPPVLDVERKAGEYTKLDIDMDEVNEWLRLVEEYYGVKPIIYSDYITFKLFMDDKVTKNKLWIYLPEGYFVKPSFNDYDCVLWQYSYTGNIDGINGDVDLDSFYGDIDEFQELLVKN
jgi:lysozyme